MLCKNCAYFKADILCVAPQNGTTPLYGKPQSMFAAERRRADDLNLLEYPHRCGPEAKHFKPKDVEVKKPWWKFWRN